VHNEKSLEEIKNRLENSEIKYKLKLGRTFSEKPLLGWDNMPNFKQVKREALGMFIIEGGYDVTELSTVLGQKVTEKTKSLQHPRLVRTERPVWLSKSGLVNQEPAYIISKSRPKCITARSLRRMGVNFKIVIEPQDLNSYLEFNSREELLLLPFSDLDQGSIPVRNFVWDHAIAAGSEYHWVIDDNIEDFNVLNNNSRYSCHTGSIFRYAEDYVKAHTNIGQAGFNYHCFCKADDAVPAFYSNTRIYSCILIKNDIDFRWRGRYNEDTDLSIRILKSGLCTVLFNMFLAGKVTTMRMKGGNTDHVYTDNDNRLKFAESLRDQHPDIVNVTTKFGRFHHHVNYKGFTQELIRKDNYPFDYSNDLYLGERKDINA
tara:strand:- start:937 stop:2058 length:1122 start_codon:yes stop_codon:yes gene_type:complete